jgi:hypothetical protein
MPAQHTAWRANAARSGWKQCRRATQGGFFPIWGLICVLAGCLPVNAVHAEESTGLSGRSLSLATVSLNLALVSSSVFHGKEQMVRLGFHSRFSENLKELVAERDLKTALPKSLLRKPLVWVNEPRATLRPGFGELFHGETVEPLRCNGAGVEDSRYLYVKWSFRF